jgi:transcriptional regulator with XRE-family HTH domain
MREERGLPLWKCAAVAELDSTLLSKIELGHRLPSRRQLLALAAFYRADALALEARRIAEEMLKLHGDNPALPAATAIIREEIGEYRVKKMSTAGGKSRMNPRKRAK